MIIIHFNSLHYWWSVCGSIKLNEVAGTNAKVIIIIMCADCSFFFGWVHLQIDINSAYLYENLSEKFFMCQLRGYVDSEEPNYFCSVKKAVYGLK